MTIGCCKGGIVHGTGQDGTSKVLSPFKTRAILIQRNANGKISFFAWPRTSVMEPDYYLSSSETPSLKAPRKCNVLSEVSFSDRPGFVLVRIDPKWEVRADYLQAKKAMIVDKLILAPRDRDRPLVSICEWPVFVHVFVLLVEDWQERKNFNADECHRVAWAELYPARTGEKWIKDWDQLRSDWEVWLSGAKGG